MYKTQQFLNVVVPNKSNNVNNDYTYINHNKRNTKCDSCNIVSKNLIKIKKQFAYNCKECYDRANIHASVCSNCWSPIDSSKVMCDRCWDIKFNVLCKVCKKVKTTQIICKSCKDIPEGSVIKENTCVIS